MTNLGKIALLWRREEGVLKQAVETLAQMMRDAEYVFSHAWEACIGQAVIPQTAEPLKGHDKAINRGERELRRIVVEHLTINPREDVAGCLALMNMAKDAERVGDHGTNIFTVAVTAEGKVREFRYADQLGKAHDMLVPLFRKLQQAILDSDEDLAHEVLNDYQQVKAHVKQLQTDVLSTDFPAREAMLTILLVRYMKRINAHLGNIASGIIFPVQNIDFISRGLREERGEI